ncbi:MAG: hypothetical protein P8X91_04235 [Candidatus Bathyarchaeota archaeon]
MVNKAFKQENNHYFNCGKGHIAFGNESTVGGYVCNRNCWLWLIETETMWLATC